MNVKLRMRAGLGEFITEFDGLILDQWGVLHNGTAPYPGVIEALQKIAECNLPVAILTNSSKGENANRERLGSLGIPDTLYGPLISTADLLRLDLLKQVPRLRVFLLASEIDARLFDDDAIPLVDRVEDADCVVLLTVPQSDVDEPVGADWIEPALASGLVLHSPSADQRSVIPGGDVIFGFARLLDYFRSRGGRVHLHGKPTAQCYETCRIRLDLPIQARLAAAGDQFDTDVLGAVQNAIYPILVGTGATEIERGELSVESWRNKLMSRCREAGVTDLTVLPALRW